MPVYSSTNPFPVAERSNLCCSAMDTEALTDAVDDKSYLQLRCPPLKADDQNGSQMPGGLLSMTRLKTMSFPNQAKSLLVNAMVIRFSQLCSLLNAHNKEAGVLELLPDLAWLVQGCWVVRSEILYPNKQKSAFSGIAGETLCQCRNFTMWKLPQSRFIKRQEITSVIQLPTEVPNDIFEQIARFSRREGCEFLYL